jgi:hypothetical protein
MQGGKSVIVAHEKLRLGGTVPGKPRPNWAKMQVLHRLLLVAAAFLFTF